MNDTMTINKALSKCIQLACGEWMVWIGNILQTFQIEKKKKVLTSQTVSMRWDIISMEKKTMWPKLGKIRYMYCESWEIRQLIQVKIFALIRSNYCNSKEKKFKQWNRKEWQKMFERLFSRSQKFITIVYVMEDNFAIWKQMSLFQKHTHTQRVREGDRNQANECVFRTQIKIDRVQFCVVYFSIWLFH